MTLAISESIHSVKPAHGASRWFLLLICALITLAYLVATTDLKARETWNSFDKDIVDNLTERVEGGQAQRQIGFLALGAVGVYLCARASTRRFRPDFRLLFPLGLFLAWIMLSPLWSTDRELTIKRLVVFLSVVAAIVGFWRHFRARDLVLLAFIGTSAVTAFGVVYELLAGPVQGEHGVYRFCGTMHPNHQGINAAFLMLSSMALFDRWKQRRFLLIAAFALVILMLTKSRTAMIAGMTAAAVFAGLRLPWRVTVFSGVIVASLLGLSFLLSSTGIAPGVMDALQMGRTDSDATTLTGRTDIWDAAFSLMNEDPSRWATGFAYQSFWTPAHTRFISDRVFFHISEGHSAYFDTLLELGFFGLGLYVVVLYGSALKWAWLAYTHGRAALAFLAAVLVFAVVHGLTESTTIAPNFPTFFTYAAIAAAALFKAPRTSKHVRGSPAQLPTRGDVR
ncbi:MAG: O-antigen ligase family protein [Tepidisphaeraceae bacterium]